MLPQVILLNGTGSSGKTSIAKELQELLEEQYLNFSIDSVLYALPPSDLQCMITGQDIVRAGYEYAKLVDGYHRCLPSLLDAGCKLIIDNAWIDANEVDALLSLLSPYRVCVVGVYCDLAEANRRERERGDRAIGLAEYEYPLVHQVFDYDYKVDSTHITPQQGAQQLLQQLLQGQS
ncbi:chloramphenicol phosphotransferase CPT family protein [Motilimonas eburnea]|uniref:chloramphenicol phosphotransferase CPT family protein n=1 Tax=Motilimonas eburnea TaxID=1737488 RepID=UPI001E5B1F1E|nr:chloramphenicol phosphotransferase CPT family protein [Motilimonas eburnea]MCE2572036.1 chloramphenicol phosphotransferase CPT family protein [Motilimonas eburnea]